jgi:peptidoglycan/xylan/chitin deacetylase (PgdA/CDA1 family)
MRVKNEKIIVDIGANCIIILVILVVLFGSLNSVDSILVWEKDKAIYMGNTGENRISLMINVYWGTEYLDGMMRILEQNQAKSTFFVGGSWVASHGETLQEIDKHGHEIGNHGYLHKDHKNLTLKQNEDEIIVTEKLIVQLIGKRTKLFAPPSGSLGENMFKVCDDKGYSVIMWSKDTIDWRDKDENLIYKRATNDIRNGDLILIHPTAHTLKALPRMLEFYAKKNLKVVTVTENLLPSQA